MSFFSILIIFLFSVHSNASEINQYFLGSDQSELVQIKKKTVVAPRVRIKGWVKLRILMKKYTITKTQGDPKVDFETICELNTKTQIEDLTDGGFIVEKQWGDCESTYKGKRVHVLLRGVVYENLVSDFSDEPKSLTRNFFSHLALTSNHHIFGRGDFNLDATRDFDMTYLSSALSVDPQFGGESKVREGFTARVRYEP